MKAAEWISIGPFFDIRKLFYASTRGIIRIG
jgi:hypothetical protein